MKAKTFFSTVLMVSVIVTTLFSSGCGARRRATMGTATARAQIVVTPPSGVASPALSPAPTATAVTPPSGVTSPAPSPAPTSTPVPGGREKAVTATPTSPPPGSSGRVITANDFVPEQVNYVDTIVVLVNFSTRRDQVFDLGQYWDRIFGTDDPIRQLNAYYDENFYGQLQLRPVEIDPKGYIEVELEGSPQDYSFGWLIGLEDEDIASVDPDEALRLTLEVMAKVVQQHPEIDYQDKFMFLVLNAVGSEYGRGAAGVVPTGGADPLYDLFIGDLAPADQGKFSDPMYFRIVDGTRVVGVVRKTGYTYDDYFRDRGEEALNDQFILGMAIFGKDAPLSCASHDILHGLRRKSAYANPPEGRNRAVNCLYNLPLQSRWLVGSEEHGRCDRSINVSPYIGWWDPMGDHLHPTSGRDFFSGHPHGMSAFTKLRMGFIPDRCVAVAEQDDFTVKLAPLSNPSLPPPGAEAETMAIRVPLVPNNPDLAYIYLLLEYRRRVEGGPHPDNFTIEPDFVQGDKSWDPGYNPANPAESRYINPPTTFVSKEGVLVYLVNEKVPEFPTIEYRPEEWYKFVLVLLNPAGHAQRDDLTQAALAAGESMEIDCRTLYAHGGAPVKIAVTVTNLTENYAEVHITREYLR